MNRIFLVTLIIFLFLLPALYITYQALSPLASGTFPDIPLPLLSELAGNTFLLASAATLLALTIGVLCAFMVVFYDFPGRPFLEAALCLPLALPPYLLAAVYRELAHRYHSLGFEAENLWCAGLFFALNLYPYFYLLLKLALQNQSAIYAEAGKTLGLGPWQRLFKIILPLAGPALMLGSLLVFMEIVSDYGTVNLLGVRTLSTWVYNTWFSMNKPQLAAQLSLLLYLLPLLLLLLLTRFSPNAAFHNPPNRSFAAQRHRLSGWQTGLVLGLLSLPLVSGFLIPLVALVAWAAPALKTAGRTGMDALYSDLGTTVLLALAVTLISTLLSLLLVRAKRQPRPSPFMELSGWVINTQYAVPGIVTGIALLFLTSALYQFSFLRFLFDTMGIIIVGCVMRYLCFAYFSVESGMKQVSFRLDETMLTLKRRSRFSLINLHLPLLKRSLAGGAILVFINTVKELTLSLVLQPFNYSSLAMRIYSYARMDQFHKSALYALYLVLLVLYPVFSISKWFDSGKRKLKA